MGATKQGWITLDSVINDYLDEAEKSVHSYSKCFNFAFRAMDELGIDFFYQIKSVKLPINANKTVTLPPDYMNYTKVGVLNGINEVIPLRYKEKLTTYADLLPDRIEKTQDNNLLSIYDVNSPVFYNYWNGNGYGYTALYGVPSGTPYVGGFKVDVHNGVILLDAHFPWEYIILEYLASPIEGQEYYVPMVFREAIIAFLGWKDLKNPAAIKKGFIGARRDYQRDYYNARRLAIARYKPTNLVDIYEMTQQFQRLTIKN